MTTNTTDYQKSYMRDYRKKSKKVVCESCLTPYKEVYKFRHYKSSRHRNIMNFLNGFEIV